LESDDIVFGFYTYRERDIIFTALDCNPFTNPSMKNCTVRFYTRTDSDPLRRIYYQAIDYSGNDVAGQTNDPKPVQGDYSRITVIGDLFVGASIGSKQFTITDARVRGGGLAPKYQSISQAANFYDIGFIDGKPYPIGGALVVYLPSPILDRMTREEVQGCVEKIVPMGSAVHIRYYSPDGQEIL
jgi:hypothetical protein